MSDNAGWLKYVLMWDWHEIALAGYPCWDLEGAPGKCHPPYASLDVVNGKRKSSRDIAAEWDDLAVGRFYYRDWTDSGTPFVRKGETYHSGFWFEKIADRDRFVERYGAKKEI